MTDSQQRRFTSFTHTKFFFTKFKIFFFLLYSVLYLHNLLIFGKAV